MGGSSDEYRAESTGCRGLSASDEGKGQGKDCRTVTVRMNVCSVCYPEISRDSKISGLLVP